MAMSIPGSMPKLIESPSRVEAAGTKPKLIDEYVGRVNTGEDRVSVAHMRSPAGWVEPGQRPDFDEYTVVLEGALHVEHEDGTLEVQRRPGRARAGRGVGALLHARGRFLHCGVPARVRAGHRAPRRRLGQARATAGRLSHRDVFAAAHQLHRPARLRPRARGRQVVGPAQGRRGPAAAERDGSLDHARARAAHHAAAAARDAAARPRRSRPGAPGRDDRPLPDPQAPQRHRR